MQLTGWNIINPVVRLLICSAFTDVIIMIPSVWMENFFFIVSHIFRLFDTDKAIALVFNLGSIKETANTEETGLFCHCYINLLNHFLMCGLNDVLGEL